ncbi:MAG: Cupin domain [Actinomycetota bacterium]|jgi:quercetin dioxygenase-like cupin family protein
MSPTDVDDTTSWQRVASRASHPSAVPELLGPGELLLEIAAGLGRVTVPFDLTAAPPQALTRELVLSTPIYDVWVMHWPAGEAADLHVHEQFVAFHVVSGELVDEQHTLHDVQRRTLGTGDTALVAPATPHRVISTTATTTVHVHAKDPA